MGGQAIGFISGDILDRADGDSVDSVLGHGGAGIQRQEDALAIGAQCGAVNHQCIRRGISDRIIEWILRAGRVNLLIELHCHMEKIRAANGIDNSRRRGVVVVGHDGGSAVGGAAGIADADEVIACITRAHGRDGVSRSGSAGVDGGIDGGAVEVPLIGRIRRANHAIHNQSCAVISEHRTVGGLSGIANKNGHRRNSNQGHPKHIIAARCAGIVQFDRDHIVASLESA